VLKGKGKTFPAIYRAGQHFNDYKQRRMDMGVMVGKKAPDFTAKAYHKGAEKEIKLSDFNGKWVMLCFYPADFTCV